MLIRHMARLFIFFLLLCIAEVSQACDCKIYTHKEAFRIQYSRSSHIFIADVIAWNEETGEFSLRVEEMLKGQLSFRNIRGKSEEEYCGVAVDNGRWIIYGNFDKNGKILISGCGISRPLNHPEIAHGIDYRLPSPPYRPNHPEHAISMKRFHEDLDKLKAQAAKDLEWELHQLRGRR